MPWPSNIPADLRHRLDAVLSLRSCGAAEVWGEVRDWLIKHGVEGPDRLLDRVRHHWFPDCFSSRSA